MKTEKIDQYSELHNKLNELLSSVQDEFNDNLKQLFENNPTLARIEIRLDNHEFNDGDPTSFSLFYEEVTVIDTEGNKISRLDYEQEDPYANSEIPLIKAVYDLFNKYDVNGFHEYLYGDEHDRYIEISRRSVQNN